MAYENALKKNKYEVDMCNGPLFRKMIVYAVPLMLSGILQLLFNAADMIVVGRFAGEDALAAVGTTGSLINLLINVFVGLSVGTNVLVARYFGAGQKKELNEIVHTAIATAIVSGVFLVVVGCLLAEPALRLMGTPDNVIDMSVLYMRIYFCGMPVMMLYYFGSAILRAIGDTKRPLYYLLLAGVVNVVLNLIFVIVFHMDVAGVALATVISQAISAALVIRCLIRTDADYRLNLKALKIHRDKFLKMFQIGLPAGLQGALFSVSNVLIQSSVNSFGSIAIAGNTASGNLEGFVYTSMNALYQTSISFTGQNYGARKYKRISKILWISELTVIGVGLIFGNLMYLFSDKLLFLYSDDPAAIEVATLRLSIICTLYFLCGMMDVIVGSLRGMGYAIMPMIVSLSGACIFRIVWVVTIFREINTLKCLYWSYPISWLLTFLVHLLCFIIVYRRLLRSNK